jgi:hypothetical protein
VIGAASGSTIIEITPTNDLPTGIVTVTGVAKAGQQLSATNTIADLDGLGVVSYQWLADGVNIHGAINANFTPSNEFAGNLIAVAASYVDGFGAKETLISHSMLPMGGVFVGGIEDNVFIGAAGIDSFSGGAGNDLFIGNAGNDTIDGGSGTDVAIFNGKLSSYILSHDAKTYTVAAKTGTSGTDLLSNVESLRFSDMTVNLAIQGLAATTPQADVQRLIELYVAFFNRVPEADGLAYWIGDMKSGNTINAIADIFYEGGLAYSELTDFTANMSNADFVNVIFRNVLGRPEGADAEGLAYWSTELLEGRASRGSLVSFILDSAHSFKGNATWGWVADLLDNKIAVAKTFTIDWGLGYASSETAIIRGMAIAAAVTPTDTHAAIELIGIAGVDMQLS